MKKRFNIIWLLSIVMLCGVYNTQLGIAHAASISIPATGQTSCWDSAGTEISCAGTGQDGLKLKGIALPSPRFTDNGDQTVSDNLTGLVWSKDGSPGGGMLSWQGALDYIETLNSQNWQGHNDWRLPNIKELSSLLNHQQADNVAWLNSPGGLFVNVQAGIYWSSTSSKNKAKAWIIGFDQLYKDSANKGSGNAYFWPVRHNPAGPVYSLTISKSGSGNGVVSSNPIGMSCGNICSVNFVSGQTVTMTANPDSVSTVTSWTGCDLVNGNQCTVTVNGPKNVTANITHNPPTNSTVAAEWGGDYFDLKQIPAGLSGVTAISSGRSHAVALKNDGTVVAWGNNDVGRTVIPAGLNGVTAIAAGEYHTLALKNDGTVVAWGGDSFGATGATSVPAGLSGVTAIAASWTSVALKSDGTVVEWGIDYTGIERSAMPAGLSGVAAIATGGTHTLALKNDGTVVAWGRTTGATSVPAGLNGVVAISANYHTSLALKSDGTVVAWGDVFGSGQSTVPAGLSGVVGISAGFGYSMALKSDGTVVAWGLNNSGQTSVPSGLNGVLAISAGGYRSMAIYTDADNGGPTGSLQINGGVTSTGSTSVALTLSCSSVNGCAEMKFSNDLVTWSAPEPFATSKTWTLSGSKLASLVYVKFKDTTGKWSITYIKMISYDTNHPSPPGAIEVLSPTAVGQLVLVWVKPRDSDFSHIHIYRSIVAGTLGALIADNQTGIKYTDTALASQAKYYYTVRSVDNAGNESLNNTQYFGTTLDATPPAWVTGLTVTNPGIGGQLNLTWSASSAPDLAFYRIYRSTNNASYELIKAQGFGTTTTDIGLTNGQEYWYSITAVDTAGNESEHSSLHALASATPSAADMTPPIVVSCATALSQPVPKTGDTVLHSWSNPVDSDFATLRIYASSVNGQLGSKVFEGNATSYTHSGLTAGSSYYYTYRSVDTFGNETTNTSQCSITPSDEVAPLCPTRLTATVSDSTVQLGWTRSGSSDVSNYLLYGDNGDGSIDYVTPLAVIAQGSQTGFNWSSGTLTQGTTYLYSLRAEDSVVPANVAGSCGVVNVTIPAASPACGTSATIKHPFTGKKIAGNSVNVMPEVSAALEGTVAGITFQYRPTGGGTWSPLPSKAQSPNPDNGKPWFVLWDTVAETSGSYDLRAVVTCTGGNTDPAAGYITVTVDQVKPDLTASEAGTSSDLYKIAPSTTIKRDLDTGGTTSLSLPAGALDDDTTVLIADVPTPPALPSGYQGAGIFRNITFGNSQHTLADNKVATLEVSYLDANNDGIVDNTTTRAVELQLCDYDNSTWKCLDSIVDTINKKVKAKTNQFSIYGLLVPTKPFGSGWSMLAVPLSPTNPAPSTVFSGASQITSYDPTTGTYPIPGSIQAGRAYWVRNGSAGNLNVIGTETPNSTVNVPVKKGWNLVGNPFRYKVAIADLKVNSVDLATAEITGDALATFYHYKNGVFETTSLQDAGAIEAWKGYWFLSDVDGTLEIPAIPLQ